MNCDICNKELEVDMPAVYIQIGNFSKMYRSIKRWYHYECYNEMEMKR